MHTDSAREVADAGCCETDADGDADADADGCCDGVGGCDPKKLNMKNDLVPQWAAKTERAPNYGLITHLTRYLTQFHAFTHHLSRERIHIIL
jgi:hypothetical protein